MILFFLISVCYLSLETFAQNPCPDQWYFHGGSCYAFVRDIKANMMQAGNTFGLGELTPLQRISGCGYQIKSPSSTKDGPRGEPNNGVGGACLTLAYHEGYHWNDDHCKNEYDFICEKEMANPDGQIIG